jgi:hypothetical protein
LTKQSISWSIAIPEVLTPFADPSGRCNLRSFLMLSSLDRFAKSIAMPSAFKYCESVILDSKSSRKTLSLTRFARIEVSSAVRFMRIVRACLALFYSINSA